MNNNLCLSADYGGTADGEFARVAGCDIDARRYTGMWLFPSHAADQFLQQHTRWESYLKHLSYPVDRGGP